MKEIDDALDALEIPPVFVQTAKADGAQGFLFCLVAHGCDGDKASVQFAARCSCDSCRRHTATMLRNTADIVESGAGNASVH